MDILSDIKRTFKHGSALTRLIYINLGVFLLVQIIGVVLFLSGQLNVIPDLLSVPSNISDLIKRPWTPVTYMFLHTGFIHLLFNILGLYWFGKLFLYRLEGDKLLGVYLMGGLSGAAFYVISYNIFPVFVSVNGLLLGASASVFAILVAIAVYDPNNEIHLSFIGSFQLKYVALFYVLLSLIGISATNPGGNIAHLGGAAWGWFYISQLRKGKDWGSGLVRMLDKLSITTQNWFKPKNKLTVTFKQTPRDDYEYNRLKKEEQEEINRILEKIAKSGYDSLSKDEKEMLFRQGK
ncbi:MAG TPA: rhomboid family intramembrane serine protease [Draconibacterium sp.]|jgi:membrane associated rhomboid family serine protease|nr:rhomboid family intramembrane serine protease [Draconibacterium sp.]